MAGVDLPAPTAGGAVNLSRPVYGTARPTELSGPKCTW
jgi:hypothetical protein